MLQWVHDTVVMVSDGSSVVVADSTASLNEALAMPARSCPEDRRSD
ncbi:MAG: hypothetical protein JW986_05700 [Methanotrichaceae archaeon]|nr:hypothetical protein [Methanotrichaceae archaeon]